MAAAATAKAETAESSQVSEATRNSDEIIAEFIDVHRHYQMGDNLVRALNGVSMQVSRGDYLTIMGRSGSGKSTMLNLLGCLDRPTHGDYRVGNRDVSKLSDDALSDVRSTEIGFIFQSFNLIPQLTVLENLEVPLFYQGRVGPRARGTRDPCCPPPQRGGDERGGAERGGEEGT